MPAFRSYEYIVEAIAADILAVWTDVRKVHFGRPALLQGKGAPYVVVRLQAENPTNQVAESIQQFWQSPVFEIVKVAPLPPDKTQGVEALQVEQANLLIARLERSHKYAEQSDGTHKAQDPIAWIAELPEPEDEQVYETVVAFTCRIREPHTSKL